MTENNRENYDFSNDGESSVLTSSKSTIETSHSNQKHEYFFGLMIMFLCGLNLFYGIKAWRTPFGVVMIITTLLSVCILAIIHKKVSLRKYFLGVSLVCMFALMGVFYLGYKDKVANQFQTLTIVAPERKFLNEPVALRVYGTEQEITNSINVKSDDESFVKVVGKDLIFLKIGEGSITVYDNYGNKVRENLEYKGIVANDYGLDTTDRNVGDYFSLRPHFYPYDANEIEPTVEVLNETDNLYSENEADYIADKAGVLKIKMTHPRLGDKLVDLKINPIVETINIEYHNLTTNETVIGNNNDTFFADPGDIILLKLIIDPRNWKYENIQWQINNLQAQSPRLLFEDSSITEHMFEFKSSMQINISVGTSSDIISIVERGY